MTNAWNCWTLPKSLCQLENCHWTCNLEYPGLNSVLFFSFAWRNRYWWSLWNPTWLEQVWIFKTKLALEQACPRRSKQNFPCRVFHSCSKNQNLDLNWFYVESLGCQIKLARTYISFLWVYLSLFVTFTKACLHHKILFWSNIQTTLKNQESVVSRMYFSNSKSIIMICNENSDM